MWFIRYKVKCIVPNREEEQKCESGIIQAHNYTEAAKILEGFYGNDLVEILLLRYVDETALILSEDILNDIEMEVNDV